MARPGMDRLLAELRARRLCRFVVWRLDRLVARRKGKTWGGSEKGWHG